MAYTQSEIILTNKINNTLTDIISQKYSQSKIFLLVDENTYKYCLPQIKSSLKNFFLIKLPSGEINKTLGAIEKIWGFLLEKNASRNSLIINLGGGVICDLGGFAASTFKRGIQFINIPTTLLSQVDAAIGGKNGINFSNYKNQIGTFHFPSHILIHPPFLKTLDKENVLSGYGEIIKHALLKSKKYWNNIIKQSDQLTLNDINESILSDSISVKKDFVEKDTFEKNIRKSLNFGHTFGHAFESFFLQKGSPVSHGKAIAWGIICESSLSVKKTGLSLKSGKEIENAITAIYNLPNITIRDSKLILAYMKGDKKNQKDLINFTLLKAIGKPIIDNYCNESEILDALKYIIRLKNEI